MSFIDKDIVSLLFRTESEEYLRPYPENTEIEVEKIENVIANELREQINNGNEKRIFSFTLFLSVALFKYNPSGSNDMLIAITPSQAINSIILKKGYGRVWLQCELNNEKLIVNSFDPYASFLDADFKDVLPEGEYVIENYLIDVCKDHSEIDYYLWRVTGKGKKKYAACKSDGEVLARNIIEDSNSIIMSKIELQHGHLLDFVYVLFSLCYKNYLLCPNIIELIFNKSEHLNRRVTNDEYTALIHIQAYLYLYIDIDQNCCNEMIQKKVEEYFKQDKIGQYSYSKGYQLAMEIMNTDFFNDVFKLFCDSDYNLPSANDYCNPFILTLFSILFRL